MRVSVSPRGRRQVARTSKVSYTDADTHTDTDSDADAHTHTRICIYVYTHTCVRYT